MRGKSIAPTAVIAGQTLMLPSTNELHDINLSGEVTLNYSHGSIINQDTKTKSMKINPYQNFEPMPVEVSLAPAIDRYSKTAVQELRNALVDTHWWEVVPESRYSYRDYIRTDTTTETEYYDLRQIPITVTGSGFGRNEGITVYFDSVQVPCSSSRADRSGNFSGTFTIPPNIPAGNKLVKFVGNVESKGFAYFTGINQKTRIIKPRVYRYKDDPLAQTFTLSEARLISGVDFWLAKKGTYVSELVVSTSASGIMSVTPSRSKFPREIILLFPEKSAPKSLKAKSAF